MSCGSDKDSFSRIEAVVFYAVGYQRHSFFVLSLLGMQCSVSRFKVAAHGSEYAADSLPCRYTDIGQRHLI